MTDNPRYHFFIKHDGSIVGMYPDFPSARENLLYFPDGAEVWENTNHHKNERNRRGMIKRKISWHPKCSYCRKEKPNGFFPSHDPSDRCKSGKHNHCSCECCF